VRDGFLLDPDVVQLNHGSYGACPIPVFEEYQRFQRRLEEGPTDFFTRVVVRGIWSAPEQPGLLAEARATLASFVGARGDDVAFVPNATSGLNAVIRSLRLEPGDEIVTTAHEYGAITRTWEFTGATLVVCDPDDVIARIGRRTRAVSLSHITSPTARVLPAAEICAAARAAGALAIVDGAHAPGHVPLDLEALGADIYAGNCHKWLCAPKGAGFLWAPPEHQGWIEPLVVSWGWREDAPFPERHGWAGTRDPSAFLAVPKAIEVHATFDAERQRAVADHAERRLGELGIRLLPGEPAPFMRAFEIPEVDDPGDLWSRLYAEHRVEVPVYEWEGIDVLRVSVGPYNDEDDIERLVTALRALL
jgi:isopenicillin-N epimerase